MGETTGIRASETAWHWFADAHPHEAAKLDWVRFVAYFRRKMSKNWSEVEIRELLKETDDTVPEVRP